jgi:hypothetical protein
MDIVIAATLVDTLRYRLYAQAVLPASTGRISPSTRPATQHARVRTPVGRDRLAVASCAPPDAGRRARLRPGRVDALADLAAGSTLEEWRCDEPTGVPLAQWSAAVRALRARTYREVLSQVEHFIRTTGRDWQIQSLDYGPATRTRTDASDTPGARAAARLILVTDVVLEARAPRLH